MVSCYSQIRLNVNIMGILKKIRRTIWHNREKLVKYGVFSLVTLLRVAATKTNISDNSISDLSVAAKLSEYQVMINEIN